VGVEVAAQQEGSIREGEREEVTQVRSFVDDMVIIINNKNGVVGVKANS
jgi:hypothetical protein